jgi:hypothetical protein
MGSSTSLDKVNSQFRYLTDLLLFTDRTDVDWAGYQTLLNDEPNYYYLTDRLYRCVEMYWDEAFWIHRLDFLFSLQHKKLHQLLDTLIEDQFRQFIKTAGTANPYVHREFIQYIGLCAAKAKHKANLMTAKKLLLQLPYSVKTDDLVGFVNYFVPVVYPSLEVYGEALTKEIAHSSRAFQIMDTLEKEGVPVNRNLIYKTAKDLFFKRVLNRKNRHSLFTMLKDDAIRNTIKLEYKLEHQERLLTLINQCDFGEIERSHLINIKNILDIDSSIADKLITVYADKLRARGVGSKKANIERLIKVLKAFPRCSPKKILAYLSNHNRMSDIKYLFNAFPDLRRLAIFL